MDNLTYLKNSLRKHWTVWSAIGTPLLLSSSGYSGMDMEKDLGYGYSEFLYNFQNCWGEMLYLTEDLKRLWEIIKEKIEQDPQYLNKIKAKYEKIFLSHENKFPENKQKDLKKISDGELMVLFHEGQKAQVDAVGIGHVVEPIGMKIEAEFKEKFTKEVDLEPAKFNEYYGILTTPTKLSFISEEEKELALIGKAKGKEQEKLLINHVEKYAWIQNSYGGAVKLKLDYFKRRLNKGIKLHDPDKIKREKQKLIAELKLSEDLQKTIEIIDFTTCWQDERKANQLKAVNNISPIVGEIARRLKVNEKILHYITPAEAVKIQTLKQISDLYSELEKRESGVFFSQKIDREVLVAGEDYRKLVEFRKKISKLTIAKEIRGSIANAGTAIGRAVIVKGFDSFKKVKKDDIIVASMTRPEYMPVLKKALAIVTDEGGITCHAAIVSRELGIPCVVGTKIATKVFKDGDTIEVRANHGLVRKLK